MASASILHRLGIRNYPHPFFDQIKTGQKTVEVRVLSGYIRNIHIGDTIRFTCKGTFADCKVTAIRTYTKYEKLLRSEALEKVIPGIKSVEEALRIYKTFPTFCLVEEKAQYQVAAFEIELMATETQRKRPRFSSQDK